MGCGEGSSSSSVAEVADICGQLSDDGQAGQDMGVAVGGGGQLQGVEGFVVGQIGHGTLGHGVARQMIISVRISLIRYTRTELG